MDMWKTGDAGCGLSMPSVGNHKLSSNHRPCPWDLSSGWLPENVGVPGCVCLTRGTMRKSEGPCEGADGAQWAPGAVQNLWCSGLVTQDRGALVVTIGKHLP